MLITEFSCTAWCKEKIKKKKKSNFLIDPCPMQTRAREDDMFSPDSEFCRSKKLCQYWNCKCWNIRFAFCPWRADLVAFLFFLPKVCTNGGPNCVSLGIPWSLPPRAFLAHGGGLPARGRAGSMGPIFANSLTQSFKLWGKITFPPT